MKISLIHLCAYLDANSNSRCVIEGEAVLDANHIITCGSTERRGNSVKLLALCLKSSGLNENPHEVQAHFDISAGVKIESTLCSCKAGQSQKCKHVAALLILCARSDVEKFEELSSTDLKCYWAKKKNVALEQYEARPTNEMECIPRSPYVNEALKDEEAEFIINYCMKELPDSGAAKHMSQRRRVVLGNIVEPQPTIQTAQNNELETILNNCKNSLLINELASMVPEKECCCRINTDLNNANVAAFAIETQKDTRVWKAERQFRITGSRCYGIYTYKLGDWETKSLKYFWPKSFTSKYTDHGIQNEGEAFKAYTDANNCHVVKTGLIICQQQPWLAYTPDGVVFQDGVPVKLLEIKCPYKGTLYTAGQLINHWPHLKIENEQVVLRKKDLYYGQIQLGMAVLNLTECDLIVYSTHGKDFVTTGL